MVDGPSTVVVVGLATGEGERSAGEFFATFAQEPAALDLTALPAGVAFDLVFEDEPPT